MGAFLYCVGMQNYIRRGDRQSPAFASVCADFCNPVVFGVLTHLSLPPREAKEISATQQGVAPRRPVARYPFPFLS